MSEEDKLRIDLRYGRSQEAQHHMRRAMARGLPAPRGIRTLNPVGATVPPSPPGTRQGIVKVWGGATTTTARFLHYLQREKGAGREDAPLFTQPGRLVNPQQFTHQSQGDPHQFRVAVSTPTPTPETLLLLVQQWMSQVERDAQRPLDWLGAVHQDTAHLHAHVVLRGRDMDGDALYLAKPYLTDGLRDRFRHLATWIIGREVRPALEWERDMGRSLQREHVVERRHERERER